jgi:hypothetical protein
MRLEDKIAIVTGGILTDPLNRVMHDAAVCRRLLSRNPERLATQPDQLAAPSRRVRNYDARN